ncbi:hypothetical protein HYH02_008580 [Chlamydomonas schloesseri]|uniref:SET domain-containing protein n=1 Tax=Chlamydomonas schloesseri TaxID=2026947 RepID=A0A835WGJ0_9CHLO|nr:hypothetical protein HYH02_008580 [Chlamydomonas schloesseri]|eukprot:KAG2446595.1 hypothetical protein HYH02_008580 [Chlamydomonas schloesseri]
MLTSQAFTPRRAVGPVQLDLIPGKGLGWRATRDVLPGELLLASLPLAVLYGAPGEPLPNEDLAAALRQSWPRMTPYERRWLQLLGDCCAASAAASAAAAAAAAAAVSQALGAAATPGAVGAAAVVAPLSAPPVGRVASLRKLLVQARALVAEGADGAEGDQPGDAAAAAAMMASGATGEGDGSGSGSDILPPGLFGTAPAKRGFTSPLLNLAGSSSGGDGGGNSSKGLVGDVVARYSYCEAREDAAVAELLDLDLGLEDGMALDGSSSSRSRASVDDDGSSSSSSSSGRKKGGGSEGVSVAGLWPELGLMNHSCAPSAALLVVGGCLYVRAGRALLEGEELTVSYLSTGLFSDVASRRAALRASHGFVCCCPRCISEQEHFPSRRSPGLEAARAAAAAAAAAAKEPAAAALAAAPDPTRPVSPAGANTSSSSSSSSGVPSASGAGPPPLTPPAEARTSEPGGADSADVEALTDLALADVRRAESLMGRRNPGLLQALLDTVFGAGRFASAAAPDNLLLRDSCAALAAELEAGVQAVLTAASRPRQQQAELLARLEGMLARVERNCAALELPPRGRLLVLGSVLGVLRLTTDLAELSEQATPERRLQLLVTVAEVLEAVAPGSDAHVTAAVKAASMARRVHGSEGAAARRAELAAAAAHVARYGRGLLTEPGLLRRMTGTRRRLATGSGLAARTGVLAWVLQVDGTER